MTEKLADLDERFYAEHKFDPAIGLAEYELASRKLGGEEKLFLWSTNILTLFAPMVWYVGFRLQSDLDTNNLDAGALPVLTTVFLGFSSIFSVMAIFHIAVLLRNKVMSERKIILIRRAMGVKYGQNSLILPNWRIEGADNPFGLKLFPGFFSYSAFPFFIIVSFPAISIALLFDHSILNPVGTITPGISSPSLGAGVATVVWVTLCLLLFRHGLRERHENLWLWLASLISKVLRVPLVRNSEYKMYRCKLEIAEAVRINADIKNISILALAIEDKKFYSHSGLSWRGIARAALQYFVKRRMSGGSTITQQCARTNFLLSLRPPWQRKIVEIVLAKWLESVLNKEEILAIYLTTARFGLGVFGFHRAYPYFFKSGLKDQNLGKAFILIERLGNIKKKFLSYRVEELLVRLRNEGVLEQNTILEILAGYEKLIEEGKIECVVGVKPSEIADKFVQNTLPHQPPNPPPPLHDISQ